MRHIIIGGDGFVGRHLAKDLLARGDEVVIASLHKSDLPIYRQAEFIPLDLREPEQVAALPVGPDDVVYHLAARMLMPIMPRRQREEYFMSVNYRGTETLLKHLHAKGCTRMVYFTTDMVYGPTQTVPKDEDHPRAPLGPYGESKFASEKLCEAYREKGMNIPIFRPRLIIGPGRLGILVKLFKLIERNLPVPIIGDGTNAYQFISVFDCASACVAAADKGLPNSAYNLGSVDPPSVNALLSGLIKEAGSRSFLLHTPAWAVKRTLGLLDRIGMPLMDPEQYLIADESCIVDVSRAERELGWQPRYRDDEMLHAAYREYKGMPAGAAEAAGAPAP